MNDFCPHTSTTAGKGKGKGLPEDDGTTVGEEQPHFSHSLHLTGLDGEASHLKVPSVGPSRPLTAPPS